MSPSEGVMTNHTKAACKRRFESEGCCSLSWHAWLLIKDKILLFWQTDTGMFSFLLVSICGVTKSCWFIIKFLMTFFWNTSLHICLTKPEPINNRVIIKYSNIKQILWSELGPHATCTPGSFLASLWVPINCFHCCKKQTPHPRVSTNRIPR